MTQPVVIELEVINDRVEIENPPSITATEFVAIPVPGKPGDPGPPGEGTGVYGEIPNGTINGTNTTFTTEFEFRAGTLCYYLNGIRELKTFGYTETDSQTFEIVDPPIPGDVITVDYVRL